MIKYSFTFCGRVHRSTSQVCQDFVSFNSSLGLNAVSLCDGAGSLANSTEGARTLSEAFSNFLVGTPGLFQLDITSLRKKAAKFIDQILGSLSKASGAPVSSFGSTLLGAVVDNMGNGLIFHIGDGVIVGEGYSKICLLSAPDGDDNATYLTGMSINATQAHLRVSKVSGLTGILLSSDGSKGLLYDSNGPETIVSKYLRHIFTSVRRPISFSKDFPQFIRGIRPLDDFSVAIMVFTKKGRRRRVQEFIMRFLMSKFGYNWSFKNSRVISTIK